MKLKLTLIALALCFTSCSTNEEITKVPMKESTLTSDMLIQSVADKPFARANSNDQQSLTLTGESLLKATATFKVIDENGTEIYCETFPSTALLQPDYRTANSVLKEAHLRDVVKGYFVDEETKAVIQQGSYAGL